jgi:DNA-binding XRE family transcriptional regulator
VGLPTTSESERQPAIIRNHDSLPLNRLLKQLRLRIRPEAATIGNLSRLPRRQGRRVTQEELAECLGVSRTWYASLESRTNARASFELLVRLAEVLALTPLERGVLLVSAFPELRYAALAQPLIAAFQ